MIVSSFALFGVYINKNTKMKIESFEEFNNINNGYIYFGREDCPACNIFEPVLDSVTKNNLLKINYVDTNLFRDKNLEKFLEKFNVTQVPTIIEVKDGKMIGSFEGEAYNEFGKESLERDLKLFVSQSPIQLKIPVHIIISIILNIIIIIIVPIIVLSKVNSAKFNKLGIIALIVSIVNLYCNGLYRDKSWISYEYFSYVEYFDKLNWVNLFILTIVCLIYLFKNRGIKYENI